MLRTGEEVACALADFIKANGISAAQVSAIGAFREAELLFFDWDQKAYLPIPVAEQCEVATFLGDVALDEAGVPMAHVHLVLGKKDGSAVAGHLSCGTVQPTLEIIVTETPAHLQRRKDAETGLSLIDPRL